MLGIEQGCETLGTLASNAILGDIRRVQIFGGRVIGSAREMASLRQSDALGLKAAFVGGLDSGRCALSLFRKLVPKEGKSR